LIYSAAAALSRKRQIREPSANLNLPTKICVTASPSAPGEYVPATCAQRHPTAKARNREDDAKTINRQFFNSFAIPSRHRAFAVSSLKNPANLM
jgi:hypothetical protein